MSDAKIAEHEVEITYLQQEVSELKKAVNNMETKLDELIGYARMAQGAGWILVKLGSVITVVVGAVWALVTNWNSLFGQH